MASHLRNVTLLTPGSPVCFGTDIRIDKDGRIAEVGIALPRLPEDDVMDARGALCLPGLINSHNHSPLMVVRGMIEDRGFAPAYTPGVPQGHWLTGEDSLALARLGVMEMLCAGATTIVDYYRYPEALAQAAHDFGLRAIIGGRVMDMDTGALAEGRFERDARLGDATLNAALEVQAKWDGKGRITTMLAPHATDSCSRGMLQEIATLASETGKQVHTHLSQSQMEVDQIRAREGMTPTEFLDDLGLLNGDLVAAHCIFMTDSDINRFGAARSIVAHAPIGNASFGAAAPILPLRDAGAQITICTDTKSADLFEAMRMAIASARWRAGMSFDLDAAEVLDWVTTVPAAALKGHRATGRLEVGSPADLILLNPDAPNLRPVIDGYGIVAHSGSAANVTDVMVEGEWLVRGGQPTRVDMNAVIAEAQKVSERLWAQARSG